MSFVKKKFTSIEQFGTVIGIATVIVEIKYKLWTSFKHWLQREHQHSG